VKKLIVIMSVLLISVTVIFAKGYRDKHGFVYPCNVCEPNGEITISKDDCEKLKTYIIELEKGILDLETNRVGRSLCIDNYHEELCPGD